MTKIYGTGVYDFKRHRVAEYPVSTEPLPEKPPESLPISNLPSSITLSEIQRDRLTKIAAENWANTGDSGSKKPFSPELVNEIYYSELTVKGGRRPIPLQRVMMLEVSQYLENYLWPNFDPETASFEHVMSMILMVNEKFRENVAAWVCFYDRKEMFKAFLERVLCLKESRIAPYLCITSSKPMIKLTLLQLDWIPLSTMLLQQLLVFLSILHCLLIQMCLLFTLINGS